MCFLDLGSQPNVILGEVLDVDVVDFTLTVASVGTEGQPTRVVVDHAAGEAPAVSRGDTVRCEGWISDIAAHGVSGLHAKTIRLT